MIDLDRYFDRIGFGGETTATFDTLAQLLDAHMRAIPFENLDVLLGRPVRLVVPALQDKLVRSRRGGYCFEHATLFAAVLEALGFRPLKHSARVTLVNPRDASPRTHMFLTLQFDGAAFVVDPGFGGLAPRFPVPLVESDAKATHRMVRDETHWMLRTQSGDSVIDAWASTLEVDNAIDFELANHYTATHRNSPFVNRVLLRAFTPGGQVTVMNRDAIVTRGDASQRIELADRAALRALLAEHFGFDLAEVERMRVPSIPEWQ
jgi:N-hydroxyarylamine O-acetyltransferase